MKYSRRFKKFKNYWLDVFDKDFRTSDCATIRVWKDKNAEFNGNKSRRYLQKQLQNKFASFILKYMEEHDLERITIHGTCFNIVLSKNSKTLVTIPIKKLYQSIIKSSKNNWYEFLRFTKVRLFTYDSFLSDLLFDFDKQTGIISFSEYESIKYHHSYITYAFSLLNNSLDCSYRINGNGTEEFIINHI